MEKRYAEKFAASLHGASIGGWVVGKSIGNGNSAVVFRATQGDRVCALKVFDPELVNKFGREMQLGRIERESRLIGHHHAHMIEVFDCGECSTTSYLYVAMRLENEPTLEELIATLPRSAIRPIMAGLASAAQYLEGLGIVHRDIKPSNVLIRNGDDPLLLDFGVVFPIGEDSITDETDQKLFVGTARYSAPEYLFREEHGTVEGWRALTFYQLGGILHDLIMRKPIFKEYTNPWPSIIRAVQHYYPPINAQDVPSAHISLAKCCLVKEPALRRSLVTWDRFELNEEISDRVKAASSAIHLQMHASEATEEESEEELAERHESLLDELSRTVDHAIRSARTHAGPFPPVQVTEGAGTTGLSRELLTSFGDPQLHGKLSIQFTLSLIELQAEVVQVVAKMSLQTPNKDGDSGCVAEKEVTVFRGVRHARGIEDRVRDLITLCVARGFEVAEQEMEERDPWEDFEGLFQNQTEDREKGC